MAKHLTLEIRIIGKNNNTTVTYIDVIIHHTSCSQFKDMLNTISIRLPGLDDMDHGPDDYTTSLVTECCSHVVELVSRAAVFVQFSCSTMRVHGISPGTSEDLCEANKMVAEKKNSLPSARS